MKTEIRTANSGDYPTIQKLNSLLFQKEYQDYDKTLDCSWPFTEEANEYFREAIQSINHCCLVAEYEKQIVGYMIGVKLQEINYRTVRKTAELENIFILPEFRSKGIGKIMMNEFKAWCKNHGIQAIKVAAAEKNERGIDFYRRNGFRDFERVLECEVEQLGI